jgi:putative glutamine amidotransferase
MRSKRKTIGIVGYTAQENKLLGVQKRYVDYAYNTLNCNVRILSVFDDVDESLDLLILPGGADVNPQRYNQYPHLETGNPNVFFESFDMYHLPKYIEMGTPIFGICRGMQTLAVHFGIPLVQHVPWHEQSTERPTQPAHELTFFDTPFADNVVSKKGKTYRSKVTSRHHQHVSYINDEYQIIPEFDDHFHAVAAASKDSSVLEVMVHKTLNIVGVQYHPEDNIEVDDWYTKTLVTRLLSRTLHQQVTNSNAR